MYNTGSWPQSRHNTVIPEINVWLKLCESAKSKGFNKNAILLMRKKGIQ